MNGRAKIESEPPVSCVRIAEDLLQAGRGQDLLSLLTPQLLSECEESTRVRLLILQSAAIYYLGDADRAISVLRNAVNLSQPGDVGLQFRAEAALFVRQSEFQSPDETLPGLSHLRQLATSIGDAPSLGLVHVAVARLEACRGNCLDVRRHLQIARQLAEHGSTEQLRVAVDLAESGLELIAGNLRRARSLAESAFHKSAAAGLFTFRLAAATNLGTIAICTGEGTRASEYLSHVIDLSGETTQIRSGALDAFAQLALLDGNAEDCRRWIDERIRVESTNKFPAPSWNQLSNELTRCLFFERQAALEAVVDVAQQVDEELSRRQFKALRVGFLSAKARAMAQLGRHEESEAALEVAARSCPIGAIEPLILLEASVGVAKTLNGNLNEGAKRFERASAACRAIGHRFYERWIDLYQEQLERPGRTTIGFRDLPLNSPDAAMLMSDAAMILGAGHSIELLARRTAAILQSTFSPSRVRLTIVADVNAPNDFICGWEQAADGKFRIRLRGSERSIRIEVRDICGLAEVSLLRSVTDLVRAAINRTAERNLDTDDQDLWPRSILPADQDAIFHSPRMTELLRVALRLAATDLPILISGETGTGKEVVARLIHDHSRLKGGPFIAYNIAAIPRDLVESQLFGHRRGAFTGATDSFAGLIRTAEHGTLFLDEVGDLDPAIQPKLLRFLEGSEIHPIGELRPQRVRVRIVAATNAILEDRVQDGSFRGDLFYRLGVARLELPPLRERKDEIPALAALFLTRYSRECQRTGVRLGDDLIAALLLYDWPGNIRQLANEIRRVVAMADDGQVLRSRDLATEITKVWNARPTTLPTEHPGPTLVVRLDQPLDEAIGEVERTFIRRAMDASGGRVADAANLLGISRKGLFLKRRKWGLVRES